MALSEDERRQTLELLNETNRDRLLAQRDALERIETKATILLGFGVAALQFVLTRDNLDGSLLGIAMACYAIAFVSGAYVIAPHAFLYPPDPTALFGKYLHTPRVDVLDKLAGTRATAFERNAEKAKRKGVAWWVALAALVAAVMVSGLAFANGEDGEMGREKDPSEQDGNTSSDSPASLVQGSTDEDLMSYDNRSWEPDTETKDADASSSE